MVRILLALQLSLCFPFAAGAEDVGADAVAADLASADTAAADAKGPVLHQVTKRDGGYELAPGPNVEGVVFLRQVYPKEETWPEPVIEAFHQVPWIDAASVRVRWANLEPNDQEFRWQAFDRILAEVRKYNRLHPESPRTMHIRAMGGEHVPDWFEWAGVKMYDTLDPLRSGGKLRYRQIRIPVPYDNPEYLKQLRQLYVAMRERYGQEPLVTVFHGTWSAGPWDEIFHPQNDAPLPADYSPERFVQGMVEQLDVLIYEICAAGEVAELPYSGKYPSKTQIDITGPLTRRIVERLGRRSPFFYVQSNGWGVTGDGTPTVSWGHQRDVDDAVGQVNLALQAIGTNAGGGWHAQGDWIDAVTIAKRYEAAYLEVYYADFMPLDEKNHITAAFNHAAVSRPGTGSTSPSGPRDVPVPLRSEGNGPKASGSGTDAGVSPGFVGFRPWLRARDRRLFVREGAVTQRFKAGGEPKRVASITAAADTPEGSEIGYRVRTRAGDGAWSEWFARESLGSLPPGTEAELEARLHTDDGCVTPRLISMQPVWGRLVLTVPVRVHLVQSATQPKLHTTLTEADVERIFGKVNRIWSQAGIRFKVESVQKTQAIDLPPDKKFKRERDRVKAAIPKESLSPAAIDVCYVKEVEPNGFYYGEPIVVKDTAKLTAVEGGIDEPIPRVTAHELGHALGLRHRQDTTNLMASKTSGFSLNEQEIETARAKAAAYQGSGADGGQSPGAPE